MLLYSPLMFLPLLGLETNVDLGVKFNVGKKATALLGLNYFKYNNKLTTITMDLPMFPSQTEFPFFKNGLLTETKIDYSLLRHVVFMKIVLAVICAGRKNTVEETKFTAKAFIQNEQNLLGSYQLPFQEKLMLSFSGNVHYQDSRYGITNYIANQKIGFLQLTWDKKLGKNDLLAGIAARYNYYDDNTPATSNFRK